MFQLSETIISYIVIICNGTFLAVYIAIIPIKFFLLNVKILLFYRIINVHVLFTAKMTSKIVYVQ